MHISPHSKSDKAAWVKQLFALPILVTLKELLGCTMAMTSFENRPGKYFAGALFVFFVTDVTGNSVSLANDITEMFPKYIHMRRGQFICAVVSFAIYPLEIEAKATTFLAFMGAYTLFLGVTTGVMMTDYFWVRRGYGINISHLFKLRGIHWYKYRYNWRTFVAWLFALAPFIPGMVGMGVKITNKGLLNLYSWNYVLVVAFSGLLYYTFMTISPVPARTDDEDLGKLYLVDGLDPEVVIGVPSSYEANIDKDSESEKREFKNGGIFETASALV